MPATMVGLIYSATTWRLRAIIIPDHDSELSFRRPGLGEAIRTISVAAYNAATDLQATLDALTGHTPSGDRYINVDAGNNVVSVHIADPIGCNDRSPQPGGTLIANGSARPGNGYWGGVVMAPVPASPANLVLSVISANRSDIMQPANQLAAQI